MVPPHNHHPHWIRPWLHNRILSLLAAPGGEAKRSRRPARDAQSLDAPLARDGPVAEVAIANGDAGLAVDDDHALLAGIPRRRPKAPDRARALLALRHLRAG